MNLIKKFFAVLGLAFLLTIPIGATVSAEDPAPPPPNTTEADKTFQACQDPAISNAPICQGASGPKDPVSTASSLYGPDGIITKIVKLLSQVIGFVAVIMIMFGGLKYVMSQGDPANTKTAKDTILYAVIGLVVAIVGQSIVALVLNKVT